MKKRFRKRSWIAPTLPLFLWLLGTIGQDLYSWISEDYLDSLPSTIGYKRLLQISLFLLTGLVAFAIHHFQKIRSLNQEALEAQSRHPKPQELSSPSKSDVEAVRIRILQNLSPGEKALLCEFLNYQTKVLRLHMGHAIANSLVRQGILYDTSTMDISLNQDYHIKPWAWLLLKENPRLLD